MNENDLLDRRLMIVWNPADSEKILRVNDRDILSPGDWFAYPHGPVQWLEIPISNPLDVLVVTVDHLVLPCQL